MSMLCLVVMWICIPPQETAQWNKDLADFNKSPTENIIVFLDEPFVVDSVRGSIRREGSDPWEPLPNVLLEIQGPGTDRRIRGARTDRQGRFKIGRVPEGKYRFKTTLNGFQSVVGTIVVSKKARKTKDIQLEMLLGV